VLFSCDSLLIDKYIDSIYENISDEIKVYDFMGDYNIFNDECVSLSFISILYMRMIFMRIFNILFTMDDIKMFSKWKYMELTKYNKKSKTRFGKYY